jgi:hypothetical protein
MTIRPVKTVAAWALVLLIICPSWTLACGPFSLNAIFTFSVHPEYPLEKYARGDVGVVQPSYARSYLYVAYRYLNNVPFSASEQQALVSLWQDRLNHVSDIGDQQWISDWLAARKKVAGLAEPSRIDVYRNRDKPNEFESYLNCQKDSFETAIETLDARIKQFGVDSAAVKHWVEGQDQVFANCTEGKHIPEPLTGEQNATLRADREYQIAAANFYAADFDQSKAKFAAIANDSSSPWTNAAPYLVARSLLRKASLGAPETRQASLQEAGSQLNKILKDRRLASTHEDATRLLTLVHNRLDPVERLNELGRRLTDQKPNDNLKQDLWDYTLLLDSYDPEDDSETPKPSSAPKSTDVTDWIVTFQSDAAGDADHAVAKWEATRSRAWLVAAISKVNGKNPKATALIRAASDVRPASSAFPSVSFHIVRLLTQQGKTSEAAAKLDVLLKNFGSSFNVSSTNLLRHQRMLAAATLDEFLTYAERTPAGLSWDEDGREIPVDSEEVGEELKTVQGKQLFDSDAANILNRKMPVGLLKRAALSAVLPAHLKRDVIQAAWLRAVLLGDLTTANELVPALKTAVPAMSSLLDEFVKESRPEARRFSALYIWLQFPGLEPVVDAGVGRSNLNEQDSYRDNWWCSASYSPEQSSIGTSGVDSKTDEAPQFLTAAQLAAAQKELGILKSLGAGPTYISRQVVEWATLNPTDARVPEALHLAVKSTRYGCADKQTGRWSKAAHDLLHRRYPKSDWAKRTPYWFKE